MGGGELLNHAGTSVLFYHENLYRSEILFHGTENLHIFTFVTLKAFLLYLFFFVIVFHLLFLFCKCAKIHLQP